MKQYVEIPYQRNSRFVLQPKTQLIQYDDNTEAQFLTFDSLQHLVDCCNKNNFSGGTEYGGMSDKWRYGNLFKDRQTTTECLINGSCPDKVLTMLDAAKDDLYKNHPELYELEQTARRSKRRRAFGEEGSELNIDRYMSGEVEQWERIKRVNKKPVVRLCFNGLVSGNLDAKDLVKNIVICVAMIDILKTANIATEVYYGAFGKYTTSVLYRTGVIAKIKDADSPVDVSRLLSASAPGILRHFVFVLFDNMFKGRVSEGYGNVLHTDEAKKIKEHFEFDLLLSMSEGEHSVVTAITNKLNDILK